MKKLIKFYSQRNVKNKLQKYIDAILSIFICVVGYCYSSLLQNDVITCGEMLLKVSMFIILAFIVHITISKINTVITKKLFS